MTKIVLTVCEAPFTGAALERQNDAKRLTAAARPEWCDIHYVRVKPDGGCIERAAGPRNLPYLKDLMDYSASLSTSPDDYIGFMNSDIILAKTFFDSVKKYEAIHHVFFLKVVDIPSVEELYVQRPRPYPYTVDAFLIRASLWAKDRYTCPDFVLAEPYWDPGIIFWSVNKEHGYKILDWEVAKSYHAPGQNSIRVVANGYHVDHSTSLPWLSQEPTKDQPFYDDQNCGYISLLGTLNKKYCLQFGDPKARGAFIDGDTQDQLGHDLIPDDFE